MQSFRSGPANLGAAGLGRKAMQTRPLAPPSHHARVPARARGAALRWCKPGQKYPARVAANTNVRQGVAAVRSSKQ